MTINAPGTWMIQMNCAQVFSLGGRGWPSRSESHCPIRRAMMSTAPPGANPTMMRTGLAGYVCALAMRDTAVSAAAPVVRCRNCLRWGSFMMVAPETSKSPADGGPERLSLRFPKCEPAGGIRAPTYNGISARPVGQVTIRLHQSYDRRKRLCPLKTLAGAQHVEISRARWCIIESSRTVLIQFDGALLRAPKNAQAAEPGTSTGSFPSSDYVA